MTLEDLEKKRLKQRCFYTKEEIKEILDNISLKVVVDNLPAEGIENYLYLVPSNTEEDLYNQYFWDGTEWQDLGESKVIFTDYVTEPELDLAVLEYLPIIEDTRNANVAAITGKAPFATLKAGLKILLHLTYYTPDNSTLNLTLSDGTTTGAKSIVYQADDGTALLVPISNTYGRYKSRLYVLMIYESASSRWVCATPVNKNTTYSTTTVAEVETGTNTIGKLISPNTLNTLLKLKTNTLTEVTYSRLKVLRDNSELIPGLLYRITDYQCTTTQENTRSAGHQFDIVLLALSENKLSEECWAIRNENNLYNVTFADNITKKCWVYFDGSHYNIVEDKTQLGDNSLTSGNVTLDFSAKTAQCPTLNSTSLTTPNLSYNNDYFKNSNLSAWKVWYSLDNDTNRFAWAIPEVIGIKWGGRDSEYLRKPDDDELAVVDGIFAWYNEDEAETIYTNSETPKVGDPILSSDGEQAGNHTVQSVIPGIGKGVIYRLIDEYNNDVAYDFKNIQFKRPLTDGQYDEDGRETWCYTLNVWYQNSCQDASIVGNTLLNDEGSVTGVYGNVFGYTTASDIYGEGINTFAFALGDNVVLSIGVDHEYYGIYCNTIGNCFYYNTFGSDFYRNIFGNSVFRNIIGNNSNRNNISDFFNDNTIGAYFYSNIIGNGFYSNTIGNDFSSNTIGNSFGKNSIGNVFDHNIIGNDVSRNTIGNNFSNNTIGNNVIYNTIGTKVGDTVTTKNYVRYISIEDGVKYADITTSATTSSSKYLQNIIIGKGIAGTSSSRQTITHTTAGDAKQTTYLPTGSTTVNV